MKTTNILNKTILGIFIFLLVGCQKNDNSDLSGKLVINLTDDPFPIEFVEEAIVTITKVEIRAENDTLGYPFLTLLEDTLEFNLLELRNGVTAELLDMEISAGKYDLIRLYVQQASIKIKEWENYDLKVPSGSQTGIKIFINPTIRVEGGLTTELILDFNLDKSFVLKGNMNTPAGIKGFNFKPVIRAVNNSTAGSIEGTVIDTSLVELANASVWIEKDSVIATSFTDSLGFYAMIGIPAGAYSIYAAKEDYDTVFYDNVEIVAGNRTIQDFTLSPKE